MNNLVILITTIIIIVMVIVYQIKKGTSGSDNSDTHTNGKGNGRDKSNTDTKGKGSGNNTSDDPSLMLDGKDIKSMKKIADDAKAKADADKKKADDAKARADADKKAADDAKAKADADKKAKADADAKASAAQKQLDDAKAKEAAINKDPNATKDVKANAAKAVDDAKAKALVSTSEAKSATKAATASADDLKKAIVNSAVSDSTAVKSAVTATDSASTASKIANAAASPSANVSGIGDDLKKGLKTTIKGLKKVKKNMSDFIQSAESKLKVPKSLNLYSTVRDPNQAFSRSSNKVADADFRKGCDRMSGLVRDNKGQLKKAPPIDPGQAPSSDFKKINTMTPEDEVKHAAKSVEKKTVSKVCGAMFDVGGIALDMYQMYDYSQTHSRTETAIFAAEQRLQMKMFDVGTKILSTSYKVGKVVVGAARTGATVSGVISTAVAETVSSELESTIARRAAQRGAQGAARLATRLATRAALQGTVSLMAPIMQSIAAGLTVAAGPVGAAIAAVVDGALLLGTLIYMIVEWIQNRKAVMRAKRIASAADSMDIASMQSLSNTLYYLAQRQVTVPETTENDDFILQNYVGVYESDEKNPNYDTYVMVYWSDLPVDIQILVANNDNDQGLMTFSEDVRNTIRDYFTKNQFYYFNELKQGSVSYVPSFKGYELFPTTVKTPTVEEYYAPINNGAGIMYKFLCNQTTESWSYIECIAMELGPYQFPYNPTIPNNSVTQTPGTTGFFFTNNIDAQNLMNPLNRFYDSYKLIYGTKNSLFINPYILIQKAKQLISMPDVSKFDFVPIDNIILQAFLDFCNDTTMYFNNLTKTIKNFFITQSINTRTLSTMVVKLYTFPDNSAQGSLFSPMDQFYKNLQTDPRIMNNHYEFSVETLDNYAYMFYLCGLDNTNTDPEKGTSFIMDSIFEKSNNTILNYNKWDSLYKYLQPYFYGKKLGSKTEFPSPPKGSLGDALNFGLNPALLNEKYPDNMFNTQGVYSQTEYTPKIYWTNKQTFTNVMRYIAGILSNMVWTDTGFALNVLGYIYETREYYSKLAKLYETEYADRWVATAMNMTKVKITPFDVRLPDYYVSNFANFNIDGKFLTEINNPCIISDGVVTSINDLKYDGTVSIETLSSYVDGINGCIGFSVDSTPDRNIRFYEIPVGVRADKICFKYTNSALMTYYKINSGILMQQGNKSVNASFTNFLVWYDDYTANPVRDYQITTYDPGMGKVLKNNWEIRSDTQVVGNLVYQGSNPQSVSTQADTPAWRARIYYLINNAKSNIFTYSPSTGIFIYYENNSFIVPADPDTPKDLIVYSISGNGNFLVSDNNYPNKTYTTKYAQLIPDSTKIIPKSSYYVPNNTFNTTRNPGTSFSNKEIAQNMLLCNLTKNCRGFDVDKNSNTFNLYYAQNLASKLDPSATNYFYSMSNVEPSNRGLNCSIGQGTALNPNHCFSFDWIWQMNDKSFIAISESNVYTMKTLTSRAVPYLRYNSFRFIIQLKDGSIFAAGLKYGNFFTAPFWGGMMTPNTNMSYKGHQATQDPVNGMVIVRNTSHVFCGMTNGPGSPSGMNVLVNRKYNSLTPDKHYNWIFVGADYRLYTLARIDASFPHELIKQDTNKYHFIQQLQDGTYVLIGTDNKLYTKHHITDNFRTDVLIL